MSHVLLYSTRLNGGELGMLAHLGALLNLRNDSAALETSYATNTPINSAWYVCGNMSSIFTLSSL